MTEKFDYICSIGSTCLCATALREARLRLTSGPFDWLKGIPLERRAELIAGDFAEWLEAEDFERIEIDGHFDTAPYRNRRTGIAHLHDFAEGRPFSETYPGVRKKYERRIARFYRQVRASRRVLFVWVENPVERDCPSDETVKLVQAVLARKFPGVSIELLIVDRATEDADTGCLARTDYGWRVSCGYRKKAVSSDDARPFDIETGPILSVLSNFTTRDYRSAEERRGHAVNSRRAAYARYGASSAVGYAVARLKVKICKLLLNRLRRNGADMRLLFEAQLGAGR